MSLDISGMGSASATARSIGNMFSSTARDSVSQWSNGFGKNTADAAKDLLSLDPKNLASIMGSLSPVEQGQMLRAFDGLKNEGLKNPRPADMDCVGVSRRSPSDILAARPRAAAPDPMGVRATFGADAAALIAKSPSLTRDLQALQNDGWTIVTATSGGSTCNKSTKTITIDTSTNNSPALLAQVIAHEAGHARYTANVDTSSRAAFVRTNLADEGAATLANIRAQREIIANGGADIGIAGNSANHAAYNTAYDAFVAGGSEATARDAIGTIFGNGERTSNTNQTYTDYYGSFYDANYGTTPTP
jgi:hypothetical protein